MPHYEPTPRRFSVTSVSQVASRRTSLDIEVKFPKLDEAPVDLTEVLRRLQHVELDEEEQRGRKRHSGAGTAYGLRTSHDGTATRERSTSTKERIAIWEARSRSQSKSRSKSRGRDVGSRKRISIVPEVPELTAALDELRSKDVGDTTPSERRHGLERFTAQEVRGEPERSPSSSGIRPSTPTVHNPARPLTPDQTPPRRRNRGMSMPPPRQDPNLLSGRTPLTPDSTPNRKTDRKNESEAWQGRFLDTRQSKTLHSMQPESRTTHSHLHNSEHRKEHGEETPGQNTVVGNALTSNDQSHGDDDYQEQYEFAGVQIRPHKPDFPLIKRWAPDHNIPMAKGQFLGPPLRHPPRSQLREDKRLDSQDTASPYRRTGDFVVDIPPSPAAAYLPGLDPHSKKPETVREGNDRGEQHEWQASIIERALNAASVGIIQSLSQPVEVFRGLRQMYYEPPEKPDIVKAYPIRPRLPVRIFFPGQHDLTSPALLPTLFTLHGGGFTVGSPTDDDTWNRFFADTHNILVIALNYSKAPWATYPTPLLDVEALYHAILNDESLPIDKTRVALLGFDAGANLALALAQLPSVKAGVDPNPPPNSSCSNRNSRYTTPSRWSSYYRRRNPPPTAVISVTGLLDLAIPPATKLAARRDKPAALPRGWVPRIADWSTRQLLLPPAPWTHYIPSQGQGDRRGDLNVDATDPLVSPARAKRTDLPPHVFVIAAELDWLALESWRAACRWAAEGWGDSTDRSKPRRVVPGLGEKVGRPEVYEWRGCLDDGRKPDRERFAWCELHDAGRGSTRWLLVPDVLHGFDSAGWRGRYLWGDEVARMDAEMKTIAYQREIAEWLWEVVWGGLAPEED